MWIASTTLVVLLAASLSGCGDGGSRLSKAGAKPPSEARVLTMETTDLALYDDPGLAAFPKLVERRSQGRLKVRLQLVPFEKLTSTRLAHLRTSDADLGWDSEGLIEISPAWRIPFLPFLVDSFPLQRALFAAEYDEKLLAAMDGTSLEGVAMFPGNLARPWSLGPPIRTRTDWRRVRLFTPQAHFSLRDTALRGVGVYAEEGRLSASHFRGGRLNAMDWISNGLQINGIGNYGVVGTLNVATASRPLAIVGNRRRLARLNEDERRWLSEAAADATQLSLGRVGADESELFALNCSSTQMRGVLAPEVEVAALRERVRPIYADVEDLRFRELYELIEKTRERVSPETPEVPQACRGRVPAVPVVEQGTRQRALDGEYRFELDMEDLRQAGMMDDVINRDFAGVWTARLENGRGTLVRRVASNSVSTEPLRVELEYRVARDRVTFDSPFEAVAFAPSPPVTVRWRDHHHALSFAALYPLGWFNRALFAAEWARVR